MDNFQQFNSSFVGFVQQNKIFNSCGTLIGYTAEEYNKAVSTAKEFEKILYDKGILQKPKTPEEINRELQEAMKQMTQSIANLNAEINSLKKESRNDKQTSGNESGVTVSRSGKGSKIESGV